MLPVLFFFLFGGKILCTNVQRDMGDREIRAGGWTNCAGANGREARLDSK
jgi:hypothetical protein